MTTVNEGMSARVDNTELQYRSRNVLHGLEASVKEIRRDNNSLAVTYTLKRVQPKPWIFHISESVTVVFWDANEKMLEEVDSVVSLDNAFLKEQASRTDDVISLESPAEAASLAVRFGRSGLVTRPVPIPGPTP
jgi:hypothetical protein